MGLTRGSLFTIYFKIIVAVIAFVVVFFTLQRLLVPKYASTAIEGGLIREYYNSPMNHDVIFLGDCEVYANFSPITLWEEYGITSYIRGSPQQLIWHSYYLLEDTLRFAVEKPKVVVLSVMAMQYDEPLYEPYNRLTIDGMRLSPTKLRAIRSSRTEGEDYLSYILPFFRFKDNWRDFSSEDFRYFFQNPQVSISGFMVRSDVFPVEFIPDPIRLPNYEFGEKPMYYLNKITTLAKENDIELVLVKAPVLWPYWFEQWAMQIDTFAYNNGLKNVDFTIGLNNEGLDYVGLDFSKHTFNAGLHLNVFGAELLSSYFGGILKEFYDLPDRRNDPVTVEYWAELSKQYNRLIATQLEEIRETGHIHTFLIK
ncbi:MAG: SGNH/GDSL hydrolase family protein [Oscillospiraceae bacterium]|jgi:hypothetical protein|nr:SGNH/GDSL hydrolase family protein [Oscillospiraceae bacterium]